MKLYNTLTKTVEKITPTNGNTVKLYTCGPTVYNYAHIGNFRSYLFADSLNRALRFGGFDVDWVMNLTDVDDKTILGTIKEYGPNATVTDLRKHTDQYIDIFLGELKQVNIDADNIRIIRVADVIPQIQEYIMQLVEKGYAYHTDDGTYFSIEKYQTAFGDYGELVGKSFLEGKKVGARVKVDDYEKDNLSDFALWKKHTPEDAQILWEHPVLGNGRPGWHIECSVINDIAFSHTPTDIHTGGVDLVFPHHTNEIAQSQPFYKPFTRLWAHCEHLQVEGKKMAKREKNFYTLKDLTDKNPEYPLAYRYLCLQTDFHKQTNFSWESLEAARTALRNLYNRFIEIRNHGREERESGVEFNALNHLAAKRKFEEALNDNLNLPQGLSVVWDTIKENDLSDREKRALLSNFDDVLGLNILPYSAQHSAVKIPKNIHELITARDIARANKDFARSDELRTQIENAGFEVLDTKDGTQVRTQ